MQTGFLRLFALLVLTGLSACSPTYDWREVQPADEPFAMMLPAKPASMSRKINLDGLSLQMRMHGSLVDQHSFTAAWVELDETQVDTADRAATRVKALEAMQAGMVRNIAGKVVSKEPKTVRLIDQSSRPVGRVPGVLLRVEGTARGQSATLHGLFVGFGARLHQFVVLGRDTPTEHVNTFINSIELRVAKPSAVAINQ